MSLEYILGSMGLNFAKSGVEGLQARAQDRRYSQLTDQIFEAERQRQDAFQAEADTQFQESLAQSSADSVNRDAASEAMAFEQLLKRQGTPRVVSEGMPGTNSSGSPRVVSQEGDRQIAKVNAASGEQGTRLANMQGIGNAFFNSDIGRRQSGNRLAQTGRNAQASEALVNLDMASAEEKAKRAGSGYGDLANILGLASMGTAAYGGFKAGGGDFSNMFGGGDAVATGGPVILSPKSGISSVSPTGFGFPSNPNIMPTKNLFGGTGSLY